jgi:hypothetical protein
MKLSGILLLAGAPLVFPWTLRWGPRGVDGFPKYLMAGRINLETCQDFRFEFAKRPAKTPTPGYLLWQPNEHKVTGCCLHIYGSSNGINHNCRRLEGGERYVDQFCDGKNKLVPLKANEGIGSYRIMGCKKV